MSGRLAPHQIAARYAGEPKGFVTTQAQQSRPVGSLIGAAVDHSAVRSPATNRRPLLFALVAVAAVMAIILIVATFAPVSSMDEAAGPSDTGASLPQAS